MPRLESEALQSPPTLFGSFIGPLGHAGIEPQIFMEAVAEGRASVVAKFGVIGWTDCLCE
jgi:hypothetical protein